MAPRFLGEIPLDDGPDIGETSSGAGEAAAIGAGASQALLEDYIALSLEDLIPDAQGEVVIRNETGQGIAIVTNHPVVEQGVSGEHLTTAGIDVTGHAYCKFEGGPTLFYPGDQTLLVTPEA